MQLLVLLIVGGLIGYLLAGSRYGKTIDQTTDRVTESTEGLIDRAKNWWRNRFGRTKQTNAFVSWAIGAGAANFPEEFRSWLTSLTPPEADQFTSSLSAHAESLDFQLKDLESGALANKPALMQVYVEAVVVYSNEYRKAQQAQAEARKGEEDQPTKAQSPEAAPADGKVVAEKQPSRRKGKIGETAETSAAL